MRSSPPGSETSRTRAPSRESLAAHSSRSFRVEGSHWSQACVRTKPMRVATRIAERAGRRTKQYIAVERDIFDRARDDADGVERACGFHHAVATDVSPGRPIADAAAERRGSYRRLRGLRAECKRHHEIA